MMKTDKDKVDMVEEVTQSIANKLREVCRSPFGITQHWIGMFLAREFGCGIMRKLVFLEPMAYYNHRPEFEVIACDGVPLGKNDKVQAFKIKLTDEYGGRDIAQRNRGRRGPGQSYEQAFLGWKGGRAGFRGGGGRGGGGGGGGWNNRQG